MMEQEHGLRAAIKKILEDASIDVAEERVIHYIVRELHQGRQIAAILNDPFIRNRVSETSLDHVLENEVILKAVEEELNKAFTDWDFKFEE
jgi:hypothetical protein